MNNPVNYNFINKHLYQKLLTTLLHNKIEKNLIRATNNLLNLANNQYKNDLEFKLTLQKFLAEISLEIRNAEIAEMNSSTILNIVEPIRKLVRTSYFAKRVQDWPRGYPGDFETIDYLCRNQSIHPSGTLENYLDTYFLNMPVCQQHRNKIKHQSAMMLASIQSNKENTPVSIAVLGCGSGEDIALIQNKISHLQPHIYLNDMDNDALLTAQAKCNVIKNLYLINDNVLRAFRKLRTHGEFDLILAGGLLDYFDNERTTSIVSHAIKLLKPTGKFFFTNIAKGNPYRILMEYLGNWTLIERSEADTRQLCIAAGATPENISIEKEETGLTLLVTVKK